VRSALASNASRICGLLLAIDAVSIARYATIRGGVVRAPATALLHPDSARCLLTFEAGRQAVIMVFHVIGCTAGLLATANAASRSETIRQQSRVRTPRSLLRSLCDLQQVHSDRHRQADDVWVRLLCFAI